MADGGVGCKPVRYTAAPVRFLAQGRDPVPADHVGMR